MFGALEPFESGRAAFSAAAAASLRALLMVWGITLPCDEAAPSVVPPEIRALAEARQAARARRDWPEADALRDQLAAAGWSLSESSGGHELRPLPAKSP